MMANWTSQVLTVYIQVPRYQSLKSLLSRVLQYYLILDVPSVSASDTPTIQTTMYVHWNYRLAKRDDMHVHVHDTFWSQDCTGV